MYITATILRFKFALISLLLVSPLQNGNAVTRTNAGDTQISDHGIGKTAKSVPVAGALRTGAPKGPDEAFNNAIAAYKAGDVALAAKWSRMAALQGHAESQHALGTMFATGAGVALDYREALKWWRMAAEQGDARSLFNLGVLYSRGRGVKTNYLEAYKWLHLAAEWGVPEAFALRPKIARHLTLGEIAVSQELAREWNAKYIGE
jgi:TPR repeat protein